MFGTLCRWWGNAVMQGYDAYKGYRQQDWENCLCGAAVQRQPEPHGAERPQMAALQQAAAYKQAGFDDAAKQVLTKYGLTDTMLDSWQGLSQADQDKLTYLTTAAGLAGSGYDTAARNYLTAAGAWHGQYRLLQHCCKPAESEQSELSGRAVGAAEPVQDHRHGERQLEEQRKQQKQRNEKSGSVYTATAEHDAE